MFLSGLCCFTSQYLFPDAAVEKSSDKEKTTQANSCRTSEQEKSPDDVCLAINTFWTSIALSLAVEFDQKERGST